MIAYSLAAIQAATSGNKLMAETGTYEYPGFTVDVTLSEKAKKTLIACKENPRAFGYYLGTAKPGALKKYLSEIGEISLGDFSVEFLLDGSGRVAKVIVKRDAFEQTDKKMLWSM